MNKVLILSSFVTVLLLAACSGAQPATSTPPPTATSVPATAVPTSTVAPSATPAPTSTPAPSATPVPTMVMTPTASVTATDQVVTVSMTDFTYIFTPTMITAGNVKFVVRNDSSSQLHEILLFKTELAFNKLPTSLDGTSVDENSPLISKVASVEDVAAGKNGEMTVKLEAGHYV
ncbi:MAG TPA: hypothetical protein VGK87_13995, partial [Anaerolineae bacterium]